MLPLTRDKVLLCCAPEIALEVAQEDIRRAGEVDFRACAERAIGAYEGQRGGALEEEEESA